MNYENMTLSLVKQVIEEVFADVVEDVSKSRQPVGNVKSKFTLKEIEHLSKICQQNYFFVMLNAAFSMDGRMIFQQFKEHHALCKPKTGEVDLSLFDPFDENADDGGYISFNPQAMVENYNESGFVQMNFKEETESDKATSDFQETIGKFRRIFEYKEFLSNDSVHLFASILVAYLKKEVAVDFDSSEEKEGALPNVSLNYNELIVNLKAAKKKEEQKRNRKRSFSEAKAQLSKNFYKVLASRQLIQLEMAKVFLTMEEVLKRLGHNTPFQRTFSTYRRKSKKARDSKPGFVKKNRRNSLRV